jgi:light-regulated signal transduction histidine kinase (bacteriophytochrome)
MYGRASGEITLSFGEKMIPVYISLTSLQPKLPTVGIIVTDQTQKKLHEEMIIGYQQELERKNIELAQNNAELTSFTYIASHDLQEPLRKIQVFCNLIREESPQLLQNNIGDYFERVLFASRRMQNLISSLLNYSRINIHDMEYQQVDLNEVLEDVCNNLKESLEESGAEVLHDALPVIPCFPLQINQLFTNLFVNSIKYKKKEAALQIRISASLIDPREMEFSELPLAKTAYWKIIFADNGIGFEQLHAVKIFELFQRLHSKTEFEGTGVGLAICKKVVQNHQGLIFAKGNPGMGASFEIYLPSSR